MRIRALDSNYDFTFGKGGNNYLQETDAIKQSIKTRLLSWKNDCFFDLEAGVDWLNRLGIRGQEELLKQEIRQIILQTQDVRAILELSAELSSNRVLTVEYEVQTIYSQTFTDNLERAV
jgi:hypothetical protein